MRWNTFSLYLRPQALVYNRDRQGCRSTLFWYWLRVLRGKHTHEEYVMPANHNLKAIFTETVTIFPDSLLSSPAQSDHSDLFSHLCCVFKDVFHKWSHFYVTENTSLNKISQLWSKSCTLVKLLIFLISIHYHNPHIRSTSTSPALHTASSPLHNSELALKISLLDKIVSVVSWDCIIKGVFVLN